MRIFIAGCFDVLHVGHFNILMFCRQLAGFNGEVIASLDTDDKILHDKLRPSVFTMEERADAIKSIKSFDVPLVNRTFHHHDAQDLQSIIHYLAPDLIVVGSDYRDQEVVGSDIAKVVYFERDGEYSSTKIIEACQTQKPTTNS